MVFNKVKILYAKEVCVVVLDSNLLYFFNFIDSETTLVQNDTQNIFLKNYFKTI